MQGFLIIILEPKITFFIFNIKIITFKTSQPISACCSRQSMVVASLNKNSVCISCRFFFWIKYCSKIPRKYSLLAHIISKFWSIWWSESVVFDPNILIQRPGLCCTIMHRVTPHSLFVNFRLEIKSVCWIIRRIYLIWPVRFLSMTKIEIEVERMFF